MFVYVLSVIAARASRILFSTENDSLLSLTLSYFRGIKQTIRSKLLLLLFLFNLKTRVSHNNSL